MKKMEFGKNPPPDCPVPVGSPGGALMRKGYTPLWRSEMPPDWAKVEIPDAFRVEYTRAQNGHWWYRIYYNVYNPEWSSPRPKNQGWGKMLRDGEPVFGRESECPDPKATRVIGSYAMLPKGAG